MFTVNTGFSNNFMEIGCAGEVGWKFKGECKKRGGKEGGGGREEKAEWLSGVPTECKKRRRAGGGKGGGGRG